MKSQHEAWGGPAWHHTRPLLAAHLCVSLLLGCASQPARAHEPGTETETAGAPEASGVMPSVDPPRPHHELGTGTSEARRRTHAARQQLLSATMEFHGTRLADRSELPPEDFLAELSRADLICFGERHDVAEDHAVELQLLRGLAARALPAGRALGVGLELFPRNSQPALGGYLLGEMNEAALLGATHYQERWGYDFRLYRPVFELARKKRLPMLALNASHELTQQVAESGLSSLDAELEAELPELRLHDKRHREIFDYATRAHPAYAGSNDAAYAAQVVRDETMANTAAAWLGERRPARQMLLIAGVWHCQRAAIPERVTRRASLRVVSVVPLQPGEELDSVVEDSFDYAFAVSDSDS